MCACVRVCVCVRVRVRVCVCVCGAAESRVELLAFKAYLAVLVPSSALVVASLVSQMKACPT